MTDRERRFCEEYLVDLDARAAALRAGYPPGAAEGAAGWLRPGDRDYRPGVHDGVRRRMAERSRRTGITADRVLREYARVAFASVADVLDFSDGLRLRDGADPEVLAAVQSIKCKASADGRLLDCDLKLLDKLKALEVLGRHLGLFADAPVPVDLPRITTFPDGSAEVSPGGDEA